MQFNSLTYAGFILRDASTLDTEPYLDAATEILTELDPRPDGGVRRSTAKGLVLGHRYGMKVHAEQDGDFGPRIVVSVVGRPNSDADEAGAANILSDTVLVALNHSDADIVEWGAPDVLIGADDFVRLRTYVSPRRKTDTEIMEEALSTEFRAALYECSETEPEASFAAKRLQDLQDKLKETDGAELRLTGASWAMAAMLGVIALPVGAALAVIGILRGMDFRLASQAMAVTGLFFALENSQSFNQWLTVVLR